jgi:hypothetical protein
MAFILEDDEPSAPQVRQQKRGRFVIEEELEEKSLSQKALGFVRGFGDIAIQGALAMTPGAKMAAKAIAPEMMRRGEQEVLGVVKGASDPFVGSSQLVMHGLNKVGAVSDETLGTHDQFYNEAEKNYQAATPDASGAGRVLGNLVTPTPKGIGSAPGLLGNASRMAQQGAVAGALQPVATDEWESYGGQKAKQIALAAAFGGGIPAVATAVSKVVSPLFDRFVSKAISGDDVSGATQRAQSAIEKLPDVDWQTLPDQVRQNIVKMAENATQFEAMTPEALVRAARLKSLPVPIEGTKGQLTRDPVQMRMESQNANLPGGEKIREKLIDDNTKLHQNFDAFMAETGGKADSASNVGRSVADNALANKAKKIKSEIKGKYDLAEKSGEMSEPVSLWPLIDHLSKHADPQLVGYVENKLKALGALSKDEFGNIQPVRDVTLKELEGIRKAASIATQAGGDKGHYAGEIKGVIDEMTEGKGGDLYKAARKAYKDYADEFKSQGLIRDLIGTKKGTVDRAVAYEDVWNKSIANGSADDVKRLKYSLLTGARDREMHESGNQAWNDIRAATVDYLRGKAATAPDEIDNPHLLASSIKSRFDEIGDEKLEILFGKPKAEELKNLLKSVQDLKTQPPSRTTGSDTSINQRLTGVMSVLEKAFNAIPGSNITKGAIAIGKRAYQEGARGKAVEEALNPMKAVTSEAKKKASRERFQKRLQELSLGDLAAVPAGESGR